MFQRTVFLSIVWQLIAALVPGADKALARGKGKAMSLQWWDS